MSVVSVMTHPDRQEWLNLTSELTSYLLDLGNSVRMIPVEAEAIGKSELACPPEHFADGADLALSVGGDGTMLRTFERVAKFDVPVLGINVGLLGYLAEFEAEEAKGAIGACLLYTSPSPRDRQKPRMPSSA